MCTFIGTSIIHTISVLDLAAISFLSSLSILSALYAASHLVFSVVSVLGSLSKSWLRCTHCFLKSIYELLESLWSPIQFASRSVLQTVKAFKWDILSIGRRLRTRGLPVPARTPVHRRRYRTVSSAGNAHAVFPRIARSRGSPKQTTVTPRRPSNVPRFETHDVPEVSAVTLNDHYTAPTRTLTFAAITPLDLLSAYMYTHYSIRNLPGIIVTCRFSGDTTHFDVHVGNSLHSLVTITRDCCVLLDTRLASIRDEMVLRVAGSSDIENASSTSSDSEKRLPLIPIRVFSSAILQLRTAVPIEPRKALSPFKAAATAETPKVSKWKGRIPHSVRRERKRMKKLKAAELQADMEVMAAQALAV